MNIDLEIVNRAFNKAGEEELTETEIKENQNRWKLIKNYYLSTILETLNNTSWTSMTVRQDLLPIEDEENTSGLYKYELPIDCAKPVELVSKADYTIENRTLYTIDSAPCLIYITNNYTGKNKYEVVLGVRAKDIIDDVYTPVQLDQSTFVANTYYTKSSDGTYSLAASYDKAETYYSKSSEVVNTSFYIKDEDTEEYELAEEYDPSETYYKVVEEDYPGYEDFNFDPLLSEYIETKLAAKIVLKISGNQNLYQLLYSEAVRMENTAIKATFAHAHNKDKGNQYWGEILGLPSYGEDE